MEEDRYTRITLRIPKDLHAQLQQAADDTSKSMNAEIVARLQASFAPKPTVLRSAYGDVDDGGDPPPPDIYAQLAIHAERRALSAEMDRVHALQDELWAINQWREAAYTGNCAHHIDELEIGLAETIGAIAELDAEIHEARTDADHAASKVPDLPGPWHRRAKPA